MIGDGSICVTYHTVRVKGGIRKGSLDNIKQNLQDTYVTQAGGYLGILTHFNFFLHRLRFMDFDESVVFRDIERLISKHVYDMDVIQNLTIEL